MHSRSRHDRTARLLSAQLEMIAAASKRAPLRRRDLETYVRRASLATLHAVELELLSSEEAGAIWAEAERRYPAVFRKRR